MKDLDFNFGKFFTSRIITSQPLPDALSVDEKNEIMHNRKQLYLLYQNIYYMKIKILVSSKNNTEW